jgi:integrase
MRGTANIQIRDIGQMRVQHIERYVAARLEAGISLRTMQNEMASIRAVLRQAGRKQLAEHERISNAALGLSGASRSGTKTAMSPEAYTAARDALAARGSQGEAAALGLQYHLGLRAQEAIRGGAESLGRWERALTAPRPEPLRVVFGTKGGRARDVHVQDRAGALAAVREAQVIAARQEGQIVRGQAGTLASARYRYSRELAQVGLRGEHAGHSARYAFAQRQIAGYQAHGYNQREALAATSLDLGHGDGRGKYIAHVYSQQLVTITQ